MHRRSICLGALGVTVSSLLARSAEATTSVMATLDELVEKSQLSLVGQPVERTSEWAILGGSKRIVTYTRVVVERGIVGSPLEEHWVRTLGGEVGDLGQVVAGEAELVLGETAVLFLVSDRDDVLSVTEMAQGHYPLETSAAELLLRKSRDLGTLVKRRDGARGAVEELGGKTLDSAITTIRDVAARLGR